MSHIDQNVEVNVFRGEPGAEAWREAMRAVHTFARASGCPLGQDVIKWLADKTVQYDEALRTSRKGSM